MVFQDPGSHATLPGLTDSAKTFLLPFEVERDFSAVSVNFDVGRLFSTDPGEDGWLGGVVLGHEIVKGWELDAETHVNADAGFGQREWIVHVGTRIDVSEHLTLMAAFGRDVSDTLLPRTSLLSYLGVQMRLGHDDSATPAGSHETPP
jgi:hypothetical protein